MAVTEAGSMAATEKASVHHHPVTQMDKVEGRLVILLPAIIYMVFIVVTIKLCLK